MLECSLPRDRRGHRAPSGDSPLDPLEAGRGAHTGRPQGSVTAPKPAESGSLHCRNEAAHRGDGQGHRPEVGLGRMSPGVQIAIALIAGVCGVVGIMYRVNSSRTLALEIHDADLLEKRRSQALELIGELLATADQAIVTAHRHLAAPSVTESTRAWRRPAVKSRETLPTWAPFMEALEGFKQESAAVEMRVGPTTSEAIEELRRRIGMLRSVRGAWERRFRARNRGCDRSKSRAEGGGDCGIQAIIRRCRKQSFHHVPR